jgi:hypothetical protein
MLLHRMQNQDNLLKKNIKQMQLVIDKNKHTKLQIVQILKKI